MMTSGAARQRGMTLVEVLVAFAILSGVVIGVMALIGQNTRFVIAAEDRLLAAIAADNLMTRELASRASPGAGVENGEVSVASHRFSYTKSVFALSGGVVQIEIAITEPQGGQTMARILALKGRP